MKHLFRYLITPLLVLVAGCNDHHLINDKVYRNKVDSCFKRVELLAANRKEELFSVFDQNLSTEKSEALRFLFAFMPLNDLADYTGDFFLANVDRSLAARTETSWGMLIPEDVFLHYVLPVRVNNENLDSFRIVYYNEILNRIRGKSMTDAALELNHWCHEKVTYQPSDSRTSAPMSTILSARGRCGEESTFTVAALRTAGIPARQVYTPRWAHSDDNHAWVEFWSDGEWHYMGACEPEAIPDKGWFTEPARRAMLVHTRSFGISGGNENILNRHAKFTEINNLSDYAITRNLYVKVLDSEGKPSPGALVEYQLYNYAEFYPIATVPADSDGISRFETGMGDLIVWARRNNEYGFKKIPVVLSDTVIITMGEENPAGRSFDLDLSAPVKRTPQAATPSDLTEINNRRLELENQIRQTYIGSWIGRKEIINFAVSRQMDTLLVAGLVKRSMGNYRSVMTVLRNMPDSLARRAVSLLGSVADKDLRDTPADIFFDHIGNSGYIGPCRKDNPLFVPYVLNPRISNEILSSWRSYFLKNLPVDFINEAVINPGSVAALLDSVITISDSDNYSNTPIRPEGVWDLKVSDSRSRSVCFTAICRTLGIPARLEPGSSVPQYYMDNIWHDVYFRDQVKPSSAKGFVKFTSDDKNPVPEYYIHFTLARFDNGRYNTLEFAENTKVNDFTEELQLAAGRYMLVTGNRLNDSKILANISFFDLDGGQHLNLDIKLRHINSPPVILGKTDIEKVLSLLNTAGSRVIRSDSAGLVLLWIEPDREPTKHVLNDLPSVKKELDRWPGSFAFLNVSAAKDKESLIASFKDTLPAGSVFVDDESLQILRAAVPDAASGSINFPLVIILNRKGEITFRSEGYRIGIGEQILRFLDVSGSLLLQ